MSGRNIIYPAKCEDIYWEEIYNALTKVSRKHGTEIIAIIKEIQSTKNTPVLGAILFEERTISTDEINNILRKCRLPYRLCPAEKNRSGSDRSKKWCIGTSQHVSKDDRFHHLTSEALLNEFIRLTLAEKGSAQWSMCRDAIMKRMTLS